MRHLVSARIPGLTASSKNNTDVNPFPRPRGIATFDQLLRSAPVASNANLSVWRVLVNASVVQA